MIIVNYMFFCYNSLKKQIDVFNKEKLKEYSESLSNEYKIKVIEEKIYEIIKIQ